MDSSSYLIFRFLHIEEHRQQLKVDLLPEYTIYQGDGFVSQSGALDKVRGENKMQIDLSSYNTMYLLEVEDSKGEKYYLRFIYFCPDPPNCPVANNGGGGN